MLRELFDDWDNDAIWSELSQHSASEQREKQTQAVQKKPQFLPWTLARTSVAIQSRPVLLMSIRITPRLQVCHQGDARHHVCPCRTAVSCPSIMSVGDIQA